MIELIFRILLITLTSVILSCGKPTKVSNSPRLVILYATCTLNKHYLSPYNSTISFTPNLEKFAQDSIVFEKHYTESGQSGTAFASMFTGTQADKHRVYRHPTKLADSSYLISEAYAGAGYETFFWSNHGMASAALNYGQGVTSENTFTQRMLTANDPEFIKILKKLQADKTYRAFIFTNFHLTHGSYKTTNLKQFLKLYPAESKGIPKKLINQCSSPTRSKACNKVLTKNRIEFRYDFANTVERLKLTPSEISEYSRAEELLYKSNVNLLDSFFGAINGQLSLFGLLNDSIVAFTADHGEVLHRDTALFKWTHGFALAPEVLNVPLIIRAPKNLISPGSYSGITRSIDVFPTLLGLSGILLDANKEIDGIDLSPVLKDNEESIDLYAYSHTSVPAEQILKSKRYQNTIYGKLFPSDDVNNIWVSIRDELNTYKWRNTVNANWEFEVFDAQTDPNETINLYNNKNPDHQQMANLLRDYKTYLVKTYLGSLELTPEKEEKLRLLKSMGYIQ